MKTLCVYCTRTGLTEKIAKIIADKTDAELLFITDGKERKGVFGYLGACVDSIKGKLPELLPFKTQFSLSEYEKVIVCAPVWCEDICIIAKSFLKKNGKDLEGKLYFAASHMSKISYAEKIKALEKIAGKKFQAIASFKTKKHDFKSEAEEFSKTVNL